MNDERETNGVETAQASAPVGSHEQRPEQLIEGRPRRFDDSYQQDLLVYLGLMRGILHLLSVRSDPNVHTRLLMLPVRILNRGRVETLVSRGVVYVDIALLDLLWLWSFEQGVEQVKLDPYHMLEFTLAYAEALHGRTPFEQLDPYNSAALSDAQFRQLWEDARDIQRIVFENTLAFILAHEVGHVILAHEDEAKQAFPTVASRQADNAGWVIWRRQVELAADRFSAVLCLDALYQPAQMIRWLDLVEVRRSYYGSSTEYPTPGQRASTIWSVYAKRGIDFARIDPLPPDRDMSKVDRSRRLEDVRRIRTFRCNFLTELDTQVGQLLSQSGDAELAAMFFLRQVEAYRRLLHGADHPEAIKEALSRMNAGSGTHPELVKDLRELFESGFSAPEPVDLLAAKLEQEPTDVENLRQLLTWATEGYPVFADALELRYLLANTRFRWYLGVFQSILAQVPEPQRSQLRLAPYRLGEPIRRPHFTFDERIEALHHWDGNYAEANTPLS